MLSNTLLVLSGLLAIPALASPAAEPAAISKRLTLEGEVKFYNDIFCGTASDGKEWEVFANAQTIVPYNTNIHALRYTNEGASGGCIMSIWRAPSLLQVACDTSSQGNLLFQLPVSEMSGKCLIIEQVPQCITMSC